MESTSKAEILRDVLADMNHEDFAKFIERHKLEDTLIAEERKAKPDWVFADVECKAPCFNEKGVIIDLMGEVAFKPKDDFHSNQGVSGLCVRHAVAKALLGSWRF